MKRIILIGSGGAGKSTLAREMGKILGLPVYHLDRLHWKPNWVSTPREEWKAIQEKICAEPEWIMDGNYGGTMDLRLAACDTVVFLDLPRWLCLWRALNRFFVYRGRCRPDMTEGCQEKIEGDFFRWIWTYPKEKRPNILGKMTKFAQVKGTYILRSRKEVDLFLVRLSFDVRQKKGIP